MTANQAMFSISTMSRTLGVSRSGYYAWRDRLPSARSIADVALTDRIRAIHAGSRETYGAPRIHAELIDDGIHVGRKRVERLMKAMGLAGVSRRKGSRTTFRDERVRPACDLVDRNFYADAPDRLWVADITYVPTWAGFLYLAIVLDAFSRRIVGWAMGHNLKTQLVLDALNMALTQRRPINVIHHSDQGHSTRPWLLDFDARKPVYGHRWARSAMLMTMPCARASSRRSNASCSTGGSSRPRRRLAWQSSSSSRAGTIPVGGILRLDTCRPSTTKGAPANG